MSSSASFSLPMHDFNVIDCLQDRKAVDDVTSRASARKTTDGIWPQIYVAGFCSVCQGPKTRTTLPARLLFQLYVLFIISCRGWQKHLKTAAAEPYRVREKVTVVPLKLASRSVTVCWYRRH